jgi:tetratricopeptide (TPR) repeat protein
MAVNRLALLEEMLKSEPNDSFLTYALALEHQKQNNTKKAIDLLQSIVINQPDYLATYYQLGKLLESEGDKATAISAYEKGIVIARKTKNTKTLSELNEALMQLSF